MASARFSLVPRTPTVEEYRRMCEAVGWGPAMNFDAAQDSLDRSLYCCVAVEGEEAVGMGRVVGDGAIYFCVQDVAVLPSHQGAGLGAALVEDLVAWVREHAPPRAFVGLFAAAGTEPFYRRFGFEAHSGLIGMFQTTPARGD